MPYQGNKVVLLDMFNECELYLSQCYFAANHVNVIIMCVSLYLHGNTMDTMIFYLKDFSINCMRNIYDKKKKEINTNDLVIVIYYKMRDKTIMVHLFC